jgi:hypothetical protein
LGLPFDLVNMGDHSYTFLTMLSSGIRYTCPNKANLCALMWFMILHNQLSEENKIKHPVRQGCAFITHSVQHLHEWNNSKMEPD